MPTQRDTPAECPACHSRRVAYILYGLPDFTSELQRELDEGRTVLGGCTVFDDSKQWQCLGCRHRWGRLDWLSPPPEEPG